MLSKTPKAILFSLITGDTVHAALYQFKETGEPTLIGRQEFSSQLELAERKKVLLAFTAKAGRAVSFVHLISRERALVKQFRFPSSQAAEISQMLTLRLPREIPFSIDQIVYHFHPIGIGGTNSFQTDILFFGISKELATKELELLKTFGIAPHQIILSSVPLADYVSKKVNALSAPPQAVIYGGAGKGEFVLVYRGKIQMSRSFSYDPLDAVFSMQEALEKVLDTVNRQEGIKTIDLYFAGESSKWKGELFPGLYPDRYDINPEGRTLTYLDFLFFAAANTYQAKRESNLLPQDAKRNVANQAGKDILSGFRFSLVRLLLVVAAITLLVSGRMLFAVQSLNHRLATLGPAASETKEVGRMLQTIDKLKIKKVAALDILAKVHEVAPAAVTLIEFEYDDREGEVHLKGRAEQQATVNEFVKALSGISWFSRVDLQYSESTNEGGHPQFQFAIQAALKQKGRGK